MTMQRPLSCLPRTVLKERVEIGWRQKEWEEAIPYLLFFKQNESNHDYVDCIANAWVMKQPRHLESGTESHLVSPACKCFQGWSLVLDS